MRKAKIIIEIETVADFQNRSIEIQSKRNTGMSKTPTAKVARVAWEAAVKAPLGGGYLEMGSIGGLL
jgi:hypothetical protein